MIEVGKVCMKIAGRDAGKICVIIKKIDNVMVMIDGETRRRKCNVNHLEILKQSVDIKEDASNSEVVKALKSINIEVAEKKETKSKETQRPRKVKKSNKSKPTKKVIQPKDIKKEAKAE